MKPQTADILEVAENHLLHLEQVILCNLLNISRLRFI